MKWNDLTDHEKSVELAASSQYHQPDSGAAAAFGARWDKAAEEGAPFGLTPSQALAAARLEMSVRGYAALLSVQNLDDFRPSEADDELREQARREVELERIKDGLRGAA